jgi:hypothetical protein
MAVFALLSHVAPDAMVRAFTDDPAVVAVGAEYLRIISWNYVASGLIFVASSMFQAMGNTVPALLASAARMTLVVVPTLVLARLPGFRLHWVWYLAMATVYVQLGLALWLLRREFARRLAVPARGPRRAGAARDAGGGARARGGVSRARGRRGRRSDSPNGRPPPAATRVPPARTGRRRGPARRPPRPSTVRPPPKEARHDRPPVLRRRSPPHPRPGRRGRGGGGAEADRP